jgi:1-phosphofructokinase
MILTLTPNPSIDRTVTLAGPLVRGAVQRVDTVTSQGGGKGVNISRAAVATDVPTVAVLPAYEDDPFVIGLRADGIDCRPSRPAGPVRVNLAITEPDGTTTKLNSPGPTVDADVLRAMEEMLLARAGDADWVVLAGSLPPGAPDEWYADLVIALRRTPARIAVDTSERPLAALVAAFPAAAPDLMKPNGEELASLTGADPVALESDPVAVARAAHDLIERGVGTVLATMAPHGGVLVSRDGAWFAPSPPTDVVSTVGAGDSSLFGYLLGDVRGGSPEDRLALGMAYGSAAAGLPGTTIPNPTQARPDVVRVSRLDLQTLPLSRETTP